MYRSSWNLCKFVVCDICLFVLPASCHLSSGLWVKSTFFFSFSELSFHILLHHHAAAQLLLGGQTQVLHVGVSAGDWTHAPHGRLGNGRRKGAVSSRGGLQFDASVEMRGWLLADVQASFQKVSSGGHRRQRRETGWGAARGGGGAVQDLLPGVVLQSYRSLLSR